MPGELTVHRVAAVLKHVNQRGENPLEIDCSAVQRLDSAGIALIHYLRRRKDNVEITGIPSRLQSAVDRFEHRETGSIGKPVSPEPGPGMVVYLSGKIRKKWRAIIRYLSMMADTIYYSLRYLIRRRGVYHGSVTHQVYYMGYDSFPIVCLISFLIGITIALSSAGQLNKFGADIYLADIIGFGMIRELVPLMTGIILAGKIGASITAEIGSMKVLEEVDALKTMGLTPEEYLVVPKLFGVTLAIPLLTAMADLVGVMGGVLVGRFFSDIPVSVFMEKMLASVGLVDFLIGMVKMLVFGWIVVFSASYKGFTVGRGPEGVGRATTESVVLSISLIIVIDCCFAVILY